MCCFYSIFITLNKNKNNLSLIIVVVIIIIIIVNNTWNTICIIYICSNYFWVFNLQQNIFSLINVAVQINEIHNSIYFMTSHFNFIYSIFCIIIFINCLANSMWSSLDMSSTKFQIIFFFPGALLSI